MYINAQRNFSSRGVEQGMRLPPQCPPSSAALSARALKALEYCLGGRENRNLFRIPIEHSNGEGAIDDAKYRRRLPFVDCEGLYQIG